MLSKETGVLKMIDKKDLEIIEILRQEGQVSAQHIAKKTGIPITTVHNRIKRLKDTGIIKGFTVVLDNKRLGKMISAYIFLTVNYKLLKQKHTTQQKLAEALSKTEYVETTSMITGTNDIILKLRVPDIDQLDEFVTKYLRNVDGVEKTQTLVILSEY